MIATILSFLTALPKLYELWKLAEKEIGPDWDKRLIEGVQAYQRFKDAKTPEARLEAEREVAKSWFIL